ncbi:3-dehydroquinate synthase [Francisellaceae bacterium CB299]
MIQKLQVNPTASLSYDIVLDSRLDYSYINQFIKNKQVLIVTNTTIEKRYLLELKNYVESIASVSICILEDGEQYKSQISLDKILSTLLQDKFTRSSTVLIALGGGVIGDITGFAAAIYQRGVDFIQIPTTLLSQVDSSVGGKTAINHALGKNMIGAFYQPRLVYTTVAFYKTLPQREYISGMAEVIKYGFINKNFYNWLENNRDAIVAKDTIILIEMIKRSCEIKAQVVAEDERELTGARAILNFGHTFGHAIEKCQAYEGLRHGEAVGVGMAQAINLSYFLGSISELEAKTYKDFIVSFGVSIDFPIGIDTNQFIDAMLVDKKNSLGELKFILLDKNKTLKITKVSKAKVESFLQTQEVTYEK